MINMYKWSRLTVLAVCGSVLVLNFQNCAPPTGAEAEGLSGSDLVTTIDPSDVGDVSFVEKTIRVAPSAESVAVNGVCAQEQSGATLRWELFDSLNASLGEGYVDCDRGGFRVELEPVQELVCGRTYTLQVQFGLKAGDSMNVRRECEQVAQVE